jgi:hypothetical protein
MIELEAQDVLRIYHLIDKQIGNQLSVSFYVKATMGLKWELDEDFYEVLRDNMKSSIKYGNDLS